MMFFAGIVFQVIACVAWMTSGYLTMANTKDADRQMIFWLVLSIIFTVLSVTFFYLA